MQDAPEERAGAKALPNEPVYETFVLPWKGQALTLRWCVQWFGDVTAHLEIVTDDRSPHPISETGYRSHFVHRQVVEVYSSGGRKRVGGAGGAGGEVKSVGSCFRFGG